MNSHLIGILGGTFDPIHRGHLHLAKRLMQALPLQHIRFIPCKIPVLKTEAHASPQHRLAMLRLALAGDSSYVIDTRELDRTSPSYMVETLVSLQQDFPTAHFCLLLGMDTFLQLPQWHQWQRLLQLSHLVIVNRPNTTATFPKPLKDLLSEHQINDNTALLTTVSGKIRLLTIDSLPISSSQIRQCLKQQNVTVAQQMLPNCVMAYIQDHYFYY